MLLAFASLALSFASPANAQAPSLVGLWSHTAYLPNGQPFASYWVQFTADGQIVERLAVSAGISEYYGTYAFDPQNSVLRFSFTDYAPKQNCAAVCLPVQPVFPIGTVYTVPLQFQSPDTFIWMDASGPMQFVRQQ